MNELKLADHIATKFDLTPLMLFKGSRPEIILKYWNFSYAMLLDESNSFSAATKLHNEAEVGHFCGLHCASLKSMMIKNFFGRMRASKKLTDQVPGLTEYVEWLHPIRCFLEPVPKIARIKSHPERVAHWRTIEWISEKKKSRLWKPPERQLVYPYFSPCSHVHHANDTSLVARVHGMVPKGIPAEIKGDLCQDLLVGVLSGDFTVDNIPDQIARYLRAARKFMPDQPRHVSFDAAFGNGDDRTMHDVFSDNG